MGTELSPRQMALVKSTIAADCNQSEFDLFMSAAKSYGLDPFRKQIIPIVFSKNNDAKRKMSIIATRDGLRVIAQRCGNYRPASEKAEIVQDESLVSPTNPKGLVSVSVRLFQQDNKGEWFPVLGEAYWDEFAPVVDEWAYDQEAGKRKPTGKKTVDGNWAKMPIVMLTKCAESQALRAGWPDQFGGLYSEEEMDKARHDDLTASEMVEVAAQEAREARVGSKGTITTTFAGGHLESVPVGEFMDKVLEHVRDMEPIDVAEWQNQNRIALQHFWAAEASDALELKKVLEDRTKQLESAA